MTGKTEKIQQLFRKYWWILLVIGLLIFYYPNIVDWSETQRVNIPIITRYESIKKCENLVLAQLKSPSTANFLDVTFEFTHSPEPSEAISQRMEKCDWPVPVDLEANKKKQAELKAEYDKWIIQSVEYNQWIAKLSLEECGLTLNELLAEDEKKYDELNKTIKDKSFNRPLMDLKTEISDLNSLIIWNNEIKVEWNIDSENSFGAMIRNQFSCIETQWNDMHAKILE